MTSHPWSIVDSHEQLKALRRNSPGGCCAECPSCADDFDCSVCCRPTVQWQWFFRGLELGSILFLSVWLFDNSAIVCKWGLVDPYPNGLATLFMMIAGILLDFAYAHYNESNKLLTTPFSQFLLSGTLLVVGVALMAHTTLVASFIGGLLLAIALPSLWYQILHDIKLLRDTHSFGFALPIAGVTLTILYFGSIAILAGGVSPFFGSTGGNPTTWLWLPTGFILFGPLLNYIRRFTHLTENWQVQTNDNPGAPAQDPKSPTAASLAGVVVSPSSAAKKEKEEHPHLHRNDINFSELVLVLLIIIIAILIPGIIARAVNRYTNDPELGDRLRITSFNIQQQHTIGGFTSAVKLKNFLASKQVGFVGFQEANTLLLVNGNFDIGDYLSSYLHADVFSGLPPYKAGAGCMVMSHYPMFNSEGSVMPSLSGCSSCPLPNRMLVETQIQVNGTTITLFDTHVEFFSADAATLQVSYIAQKVESAMGPNKDRPVIVFGDFNIPLSFVSLNPLFALGFKDASMQWLNQPRNGTFPRTEVVDDTHIDHIFYTPDTLRLIHYDVFDDDGEISDHLPVTADFVLV